MARQKKDRAALFSAAAAVLGSIGGSWKTPKQIAAHKEAAKKLVEFNRRNSEVWSSEKRKAAQYSIAPEKRADRAKTAVSGRWEKYREQNLEDRLLDNDRFRELAAGIPAREIAAGMKASVAVVNSWRRQANPVLLSAENGRKFLAWFEARPQQHGDRNMQSERL